MATKKGTRKKAKSARKAGKGAKARSKSAPTKSKAAPARARSSSPGPRLESVAPSLTSNSLETSIGWYRDVVGFAVEERFERDGNLVGVQLRAGNVVILLGQDDWKKGRDRKKGEGSRLYLMMTGDLDAFANGIKARGGTLDQEPTDQPWGMRDFSMTDPDGFKLTIAKVTKAR